MNCSGINISGAKPVSDGLGLTNAVVPILTGLGDTQSRVRYSQRRRTDSTKES